MRAAAMFQRESALWDLCSVQAFVIYEDGALGSRQQAASLADKTLGIAERVGHLGAAFMVISDRIREAAMLGDLSLVAAGSVRRQSASLLALHLAHLGRADEVLELFEAIQSTLPTLDRVDGIGAWNCMLGFVEALYLCGLHEQAATLSPLLERALELGRRWITLDDRLLETRAGIAAASASRWDEAERQFATAREVAEQMCNRLELADLSRLHARMLLDRGGVDDHAGAAEMLNTALNSYRAFGMPAYAAESERLLHRARGAAT